MSREEFARRVREYRVTNGFTQECAAEELGISVRTLQNWEIARNMPRGFGLNALLQTISPGAHPPGPSSKGSTRRARKTTRPATLHSTRPTKAPSPAGEEPALATHLL